MHHLWANTNYPTIPRQQKRVSEGMGLYLPSFLRGIRCFLSPGLPDLHGCHNQPAAWTEWHGPTEICPNLIWMQLDVTPSLSKSRGRKSQMKTRWIQVRINGYFYCICIFPAKVSGDVMCSSASEFLAFSYILWDFTKKGRWMYWVFVFICLE